MAEYTEIEYELRGTAAIIRLNRPEKLNALTSTTLAEIRLAVDTAAADASVVGIVITGNGRGFCSGLDSAALIASTTAGSAGRGKPKGDDPHGMFSYLLHVPKPVIAAVNGVAAGGGLVLALVSDVRIASTAASFTTIFSKRGLVSEHGTSWIMPRLMGVGRSLDLLWTSRRIDAEEALRTGMVEYVCEPDELVDRACAYVADLAENVSPQAIADIKRLVYRHAGMGYVEALEEADAATYAALDRPDSTEGARALVEKRPPRFARLGSPS